MKALILTSSLNNNIKVNDIKVAQKCDNLNGFVDRIRNYLGNTINKLVYIASDPADYVKVDMYSDILMKSLELDGFIINEMIKVDNRFNGNIEELIKSADLILLSGGHVPTQNKFFHKLNLKKLLKSFVGVVVGQSAGSMNCSKIVYVPPEKEGEFTDDFVRYYDGLGLTDINIMPHMDISYNDNINGNGKNTIDYCFEDSYNINIYGLYDSAFIEVSDTNTVIYGKAELIKQGKVYPLCEHGDILKLR